MIPEIRSRYNAEFSDEKYQAFLQEIDDLYGYKVLFRQAETPIFVPRALKEKIFQANEDIIKTLTREDFMAFTHGAVPEHFRVPNENKHSLWLAIDYAVCRDADGELEPQLIELQGITSLYCYQAMLAQMYRKHFNVPEGFSFYFNGLNADTYNEAVKDAILGGHNPENVVLLEIEPEKQKTAIDFYCACALTGIEMVCISNIIREGRSLFYVNRNGEKTPIKRFYNRVIFDEFAQREDMYGKLSFNMIEDVDVEWACHPNWYFRISKWLLPHLSSKYVPQSYFLNDLADYPADLENYVLKPLYSFAGMGVIIDVKREDLDAITDRENYLLQRKVEYTGAIDSPTGPVKCELRMLFIWHDDEEKPRLVGNLGRMSKGKMIGVRYNSAFDWVGGTSAFFEE